MALVPPPGGSPGGGVGEEAGGWGEVAGGGRQGVGVAGGGGGGENVDGMFLWTAVCCLNREGRNMCSDVCRGAQLPDELDATDGIVRAQLSAVEGNPHALVGSQVNIDVDDDLQIIEK